MKLKLFGWEIELRRETRLEELERIRAAWLKQFEVLWDNPDDAVYEKERSDKADAEFKRGISRVVKP